MRTTTGWAVHAVKVIQCRLGSHNSSSHFFLVYLPFDEISNDVNSIIMAVECLDKILYKASHVRIFPKVLENM